MKLESLVIVDQNATVNYRLDLAHTARHMLGLVFIWRYSFNLNYFLILNSFLLILYNLVKKECN